MLQETVRDVQGKISFHDAQKVIVAFRKERIQQCKLVFPLIGKKHTETPTTSSLETIGIADTKMIGPGESALITRKPKKRIARVGE